ncbi:hypothetical protein ABID82_004019 [Methylobacterium sp. PvP062]|uniref:Uncharacterized protein n=1 Tax=Methylobacterium radiotolerans TaxID=31998 RepID=A0ABV2NG29_9HYPH|nr:MULTISPECIES: hypothetical protein [unclassified Methylobacterium]MBP2497814.1 hypothetical protein [Methylobacterium sp. PvP105]MBP2502315.1 hypothetical protein [Methylobacterium sp. PvP109]MCX7335123.1 hypothetical protein [Hyphomicrobiales bacterium]
MGALKPEALVVGRTGGFFVSAGPAPADDTPTTRRRHADDGGRGPNDCTVAPRAR